MNLKYLRTKWFFILLIILIVLVRYIGIWYGYPFIYNVDEPALVRTTLGIRFNPIIEHFDWPHFNYYFHYVFYWIFIKARSIAQLFPGDVKKMAPIFWEDGFVFYLISRFINTTLSLISGISIYYIVKRISKSISGSRLSTILYLLMPYAAYHSRLAIQDSALMSWVAFYLLFLYLYYDTQKHRYLFVGAILLGLATGVKYNAILFLGLVPVIEICLFWLHQNNIKNIFIGTIVSSLIAIFVFLITSPGILLNWSDFWSYKDGVGFLWQIKVNLSTYKFSDYPLALLDDLKTLVFDLGVVELVLFIASLGYLYRFKSVTHKNKIFIYVIAIFAVLYILNAARYSLSGPRFYLPIYPVIGVISGVLIGIYIRNRNFRIGLIFATIGVFLLSLQLAAQFTQPTTLNLAYDKYKELDSQNTVYIKAEDMERLNTQNNLKLKTLRETTKLVQGNFVISSRELNLPNARLYNVIRSEPDDMSSIVRLGPDIFIYQIEK